ncbi:Gamma-tubulin complex, DGRIP91/SPC98 component, partial [Trachipleistophora hominis]
MLEEVHFQKSFNLGYNLTKNEDPMEEKLNLLVEEFFKIHNTKAEESFLKYLRLYLEPSQDITLSTNDVLSITKKYNLDVNLSIFSPMEVKLIYIFCKLASIRRKRPKIVQKSKINLKRIALGLETVENYKLNMEQDEILGILQNNAFIYTKFKNVTDGQTMSQLHFYKIAKDKVKEFEMQVLILDEEDILLFYVQLKPYIKTFILLDQINSHFQDTKNPYNFLKFYSRDFFTKEDTLIYNIVSSCTKQLNINLNEWLVKGQFTDYAREFFITKNTNDFWLSYNVDTGMLPFFISAEIAQKILYIGKVSNLLVRISSVYEADYSKQATNNLEIVNDGRNILETRPHCTKGGKCSV